VVIVTAPGEEAQVDYGEGLTCLANSGPVAVSKSAANLGSSPRECDVAVRIRLVREL
jgi:hypothetical protein